MNNEENKESRLKRVREGLEKDIYKKIENLENLDEKDKMFGTKTESLANFLPKEEKEDMTIEFVNQEEVELEIDQEEVLKDYDNYIHSSQNNHDQKTSNIINIEQTEQIDLDTLSDQRAQHMMETKKEEEKNKEVKNLSAKEEEKTKNFFLKQSTEEIRNEILEEIDILNTEQKEEEKSKEAKDLLANEEEKTLIQNDEQTEDNQTDQDISTNNINEEDETIGMAATQDIDFHLDYNDEEDEEAEYDYEEIKKENKKGFLIDIILVLLIVCLIVAVIYLI